LIATKSWIAELAKKVMLLQKTIVAINKIATSMGVMSQYDGQGPHHVHVRLPANMHNWASSQQICHSQFMIYLQSLQWCKCTHKVRTLDIQLYHKICDDYAQGVESLYHVQNNMSIRRNIIWGISVHSIHKGLLLFYHVCTSKKGWWGCWSEDRCTKGGSRF